MNTLSQAISCLDDYDPTALPVRDAQAVIRACITPVAAIERVAVRASLGRVLGEDVISTVNVPAHNNAAMDGWAVRHADLDAAGETTLTRIGTAFAGKPFEGVVGRGQCVRVMTGAVLPTGADTVVIQEVVRSSEDQVHIPAGQKLGQHVRLAGEDLALGKPCLLAGHKVAPADLGLIASLGLAEVSVRRRLRVAFFSTGDELASVGEALAPGAVYDSNRYTLWGMLTRLGCEVIDMGVVRDDPTALEAALRTAAENADAIITSGGVSVGEADFTRELLGRLGEAVSWTIAMRPGRPMAFGKIGQAYFFGLPGNPVAVMVTFYEFVRSALLALAGQTTGLELPKLQAASSAALRKRPGRTEYQRGILAAGESGAWSVRVTGQQGSGVLRSMSEANCLIVLEHDRGPVAAGELVTVQLFEGLV
ncbi:MAG: molybdopterin-binding protein [Burkholderiaceae bacterium]